MEQAYKTVKIKKQKRIALIAHDNKKKALIDWSKNNKKVLRKHFLCGTGTTSRLISEEVELPVKSYKSGPFGGDQQIGSRIAEGKIDMVIFFWDPLSAQPHDPDVKALLRIAALYDIPIATSQATADFLLTSPFMEEEYERKIIDYSKTTKERAKQFGEQIN